jgi:hypothetical protein
MAAGLRQTIALTKMRHELQRLINGHRVFPVAPFFFETQDIGPPSTASCRLQSAEWLLIGNMTPVRSVQGVSLSNKILS